MYSITQHRQEKKQELLDAILKDIRPILDEELTLESVFDIPALARVCGRVRERVGKAVVEGAEPKEMNGFVTIRNSLSAIH